MILNLSLSGCFSRVVSLRPLAIPQLFEDGVTDGRDVQEFVVFENSPVGDPRPIIGDPPYLSPKSETLDVSVVWEGKLSPTDANSEPPCPRPGSSVLGEYHNLAAYTTPSPRYHIFRISSSEVRNELANRDRDLLLEGDPRSDRIPTNPIDTW